MSSKKGNTNNHKKESRFLSPEEIHSIDLWLETMYKHAWSTSLSKAEAAKEILNLPYRELGKGQNRMVFDMENGFVLKIPLSALGVVCNRREFYLFKSSCPEIKEYLCPVAEWGEGWVVMEKADCSRQHHTSSLRQLLSMQSKFLKHKILPIDLRPGNAGINKQGKVVIFDYGLFVPL
ncbi:hypothetical protein V1498_13165 [Peribacillus sp. SCS-26]|uniref:hypothetical protein n=1 Tax=Paraperibacillus marinus TaxID=3115295 RepID=UPI003905862C